MWRSLGAAIGATSFWIVFAIAAVTSEYPKSGAAWVVSSSPNVASRPTLVRIATLWQLSH